MCVGVNVTYFDFKREEQEADLCNEHTSYKRATQCASRKQYMYNYKYE